MKRVLCLSDLHGHLPGNLPRADIAVIAGDVCRVSDHSDHFQQQYLFGPFREWLSGLPVNDVVLVAGNHDFAFERHTQDMWDRLPCFILHDRWITVQGLVVWGSPWQLPFFGAFNAEETELESIYSRIPEGTSIVISHGPPLGQMDRVWSGEEVGSLTLRRHIERVGPQLVVTGHIHEAYGQIVQDGTEYVNASLMTRAMQPTNDPILTSVQDSTLRTSTADR